MIALLPTIVSIFGISFFWFIGAIPLGIILQLPPWMAALVTWVAYVAGVLLIVLAGTPIRQWIIRRFHISVKRNPDTMIWQIWDRYALPGLALMAPITVGSQIGALIGLTMGVPPRRLCVAMAFGALLWTIFITWGTVTAFSAAG